MADEAAGGAAPAKGKGKLVKMIVMVVVAIALVGGGAVAGTMFFGGKSKAVAEKPKADGGGEIAADAGATEGGAEGEKPAEGEAPAEGEGGEGGAAPTAKAKEPADLFVVFEITTNLSDPKGRDFVAAKINIKATNEKMLDLINRNGPPLKAAILSMLGSKTREDLSTEAGKNRLTKDLFTRLGAILTPEAIADIYITDFIIKRQ